MLDKKGVLLKIEEISNPQLFECKAKINIALQNSKIFLQNIFNKKKISRRVIEMKNFAKSAANFLLSVVKLAINADYIYC